MVQLSSYIILIWPILEARVELGKTFGPFFCFWYLLIFFLEQRKICTAQIWKMVENDLSISLGWCVGVQAFVMQCNQPKTSVSFGLWMLQCAVSSLAFQISLKILRDTENLEIILCTIFKNFMWIQWRFCLIVRYHSTNLKSEWIDSILKGSETCSSECSNIIKTKGIHTS